MLDRNFGSFLAGCVNFWERTKDRDVAEVKALNSYIELSDELEGVMRSTAQLVSIFYSDFGWKEDKDNPGYLKRRGGGAKSIVPFHLAAVFPGPEDLEGIWNLSRKVKTSKDSTICLAGSATAFRTLRSYADIDFCEYVSETTLDIEKVIKGSVSSKEELICVKAKIGKVLIFDIDEKAVISPDQNWELDPSSEDKSNAKLDYVGWMGSRAIDVSNMIVILDENGNSKARAYTFAAQETILENGAVIPHNLSCPLEMGRYVSWLRAETKLYLEKKVYPKAMKRALSLARISDIKQITREIADLSMKTTILIDTEISEMKAIKARLETLGNSSEVKLKDLENEIASRSLVKKSIEKKHEQKPINFNLQAKKIITRLIEISDKYNEEMVK